MPRALLLPIVLAARHPHLRRADLAVAAAAAVMYILLALARPTHPSGRCHGDRIQFSCH